MSTVATDQSAELKPPTAQLATAMGLWRLAVTFHWRRDRFEHRIVALHPSHAADPHSARVAVPLVQMSDDAEASDWPVNPPVQQLDECTLTGHRRGLVGLGMAGTSHWSLAVETYEQELWFDVACRIQQPAGHLQSSYNLAEPFRWADAVAGMEDRRRVIGPSPTDVQYELRVDRTLTEIVVDGHSGRLQLRPRETPDRLPATIRWRYGWIATA